MLVIAGLVILFPESGKAAVNAAFAFATGSFGWISLLAGFSVVEFLIGLAFSRYGKVRLGGPEDTPEFSYFSWVEMIFADGIGIAIVNWAWVEPIYSFTGPPLDVKAGSDAAAD